MKAAEGASPYSFRDDSTASIPIMTEPTQPTPAAPPLPPKNLLILRLLSASACFLIAGVNDASLGPLLPHIMASFSVSHSTVAIVFIPTLVGWILAALISGWLFEKVGMGGMMTFGASIQILSCVLRCIPGNYALFASTFFFMGLGIAFQDSQTNVYVASLGDLAHRWLGLIHAMWGVGCLIGPFVATAIANADSTKWQRFYILMVVLSCINFIGVLVGFWEFVRIGHRGQKQHDGKVVRESVEDLEAKSDVPLAAINSGPESGSQSTIEITDVNPSTKIAHEQPQKSLIYCVQNPTVWIASVFFLMYIGFEVALGGWVVDYLVTIRNGELNSMGYMPMALWAGLVVGRLSLPDITKKWGEKRLIAAYCLLSGAGLAVIWAVGIIWVVGLMLAVIGFFSGPLFATVSSISSLCSEEEKLESPLLRELWTDFQTGQQGVQVTTNLLPADLHVIGISFIFVMGQIGGALFPYITGLISESHTVSILPPMLVALVAATLISWVALTWKYKP
ncbi:hypothetical protein HK097_004110 [Rhizophlyctis rosea]|uniref:Major facilitator superfamily (MFS) profile domain-containing protein n=1 Tax=Rhizophlyctis rosea TaxID=64517 RepID=A0AAD5SG66_9FUNG|nr:hypothetical protein HK097_004110 [Rhizophlyctis rosea]